MCPRMCLYMPTLVLIRTINPPMCWYVPLSASIKGNRASASDSSGSSVGSYNTLSKHLCMSLPSAVTPSAPEWGGVRGWVYVCGMWLGCLGVCRWGDGHTAIPEHCIPHNPPHNPQHHTSSIMAPKTSIRHRPPPRHSHMPPCQCTHCLQTLL